MQFSSKQVSSAFLYKVYKSDYQKYKTYKFLTKKLRNTIVSNRKGILIKLLLVTRNRRLGKLCVNF